MVKTMKRVVVVVVVNQKGGVGKTTLCAHLGVAAQASGLQVALVDCDPQGSLAAWYNNRQAETPIMAAATVATLKDDIARLRSHGADLIIIDTPAAITDSVSKIIDLADLVILPVKPSPHDIRALSRTVSLLGDKKFGFVVTQATLQAQITLQMTTYLSQSGPVLGIIANRVDFAESALRGMTVTETSPKSRSTNEINSLWATVRKTLSLD
ncbi:AAA family ATPase [Niveispirillum sp. SYP-B3756]|nr:AAA family ATPase [Niveispirillum sp. SYP-B3756]